MEVLAFFLVVGFIAMCVFLTLVFARINALTNDVERLKQDHARLSRELQHLRAAAQHGQFNDAPTPDAPHQPQPQPQPESKPAPPSATQAPEQPQAPSEAPLPPLPSEHPPQPAPEPPPRQSAETPAQQPVAARVKAKPSFNFERQFGAQLPVWIGGIALALAGFYLVKYSIENNLLSPVVRVSLGGLLGVALLATAEFVRRKPDFANGVRIMQSLSGAGIAVCYATLFAAANLYQLIPGIVCFFGMAGVTALAVLLSLKHGPPIALLGLLGGFLTPALVGSSDPSAPPLFIYLFLAYSGLMTVIQRKKWWGLSIPALLGAFFWVIYWMSTSFTDPDGVWLGLFLMGVSTTLVISTLKANFNEGFPFSRILNIIGLGGSIFLMGIIVGQAGFGWLDWALFALLAIGGVGLSFFDDKRYGFLPLLSMAVNLVMLAVWQPTADGMLTLTLLIFAAIHSLPGCVLMWRTPRPLRWANLTGATWVGYYLLAFAKLEDSHLFANIPIFWGMMALALVVAATFLLQQVRSRLQGHPQQEKLLGVFAVTATSMLTLSLTIEVDRHFLPVAIALQLLATSYIQTRIEIKVWRPICAVLTGIFGLMMIPQVSYIFEQNAVQVLESGSDLLTDLPIAGFPSFHLGLPALALLGAAYLLGLKKDGTLNRTLEMGAVACIAMLGYFFIRHGFHTGDEVILAAASFLERGLTTNLLFIIGLASLFGGKTFNRKAFSNSGTILIILALFRIAYLDLLYQNPLFNAQEIAGPLIFNSLLLPYGAPILWLWIAGNELTWGKREETLKLTRVSMLILLFTLVSMNVRYFFHGTYLDAAETSNAEVYSYSVAWLLLGVALLLGGVQTGHKMLRYASLAVILLAVGKVFLYDASQLEGLYRVFSFFGLGLSLIGLSWFYTRYVFKNETQDEDP